MNLWLSGALFLLTMVLIALERRGGARLSLKLNMKGDIKRESAFLAQYGQSIATPLAAILVWQLDGRWRAIALFISVCAAALSGTLLKRLTGRVRPNRERAGHFLGPTLKHANHRESFPSNHTAAAFALSTVLAQYYPAAAITFWALAGITALLRYALDAHWPSDIIFGGLLGYVVAHGVLALASRQWV